MLKAGIKGEQTYTVQVKDTAKEMGIGNVEVLSTSSMIMLMESTACKSLAAHLDERMTTISKSISAEHFCPTPIGSTVRCESELVKVEGKNLIFEVKAHDSYGVIGSGLHERTLVDTQYFMMKALVKKEK